MNRKQKEFEEVALKHIDAVFRMATTLCSGQVEAEDMVQVTYLKAFEQFGSFKKGTNCRAWLFKILRNSWIDQLRRTKVRGDILPLEDELVAAPIENDQVQWSNYDDLLENFSDHEVIKALQRLPGDQRLTLFLTDVEQLDHGHVARILDVATGTVKSRTSRARAILKRELLDHAKQMGYSGSKK